MRCGNTKCAIPPAAHPIAHAVGGAFIWYTPSNLNEPGTWYIHNNWYMSVTIPMYGETSCILWVCIYHPDHLVQVEHVCTYTIYDGQICI